MQRVNLPIGTSDFARIRKSGCYYIDKTGLIGEILNTSGVQVMLITRPRRFGKTLGMNMLTDFFETAILCVKKQDSIGRRNQNRTAHADENDAGALWQAGRSVAG